MKKHVFRVLSLVLALALLLPSLTSCHGGRAMIPFEMPRELNGNKRHEIVFWAKNDTNNAQKQIYERAIEDFERLYPNVTVKLRSYTDYGRIYNDVITNIATETTPNVCITYPDHIAAYLEGENVVVPLNTLISDGRFGLGGTELRFRGAGDGGIIPKFLDECKIGDTLYALPFMRSTEACYVNRSYVEKLGFTLPETLSWDFVFEVCEAAMAKDENGLYRVNGQRVLIPFIYKSTDNMMIQMLKQKGAGYSSEEGEIQIFNETTEAMLRMIAPYAKSRVFSTFKIDGYPANYLNAGQCIFAADSTAGATWMGSDAPLLDIDESAIVEFETAVYPVPQFDTEHPKMISQGPSVCIFNKRDPETVLYSWLFAQFLLTDSVQIAYAETEGYVPVTEGARGNPLYLDYLSRAGEDNARYYDVKLEATALLLKNTDNTFVTPVRSGSAALRNAAGALIENVVRDARTGAAGSLSDHYLAEQFAKVKVLYRLGESELSAGRRENLGPLPSGSVVFLISLGAVWSAMAAAAALHHLKKRKQKRN